MTAVRATSPEPIAPWAEIVTGYGPVTVDVLLSLPDDGYRYEVVEGVLVRMAGSGLDATTIGGLLVIALGSFVYTHRLGLVTPSDGVYKFPGAETGLLPDVGFVEASKVALIEDRRKPVPFAPDLAVEVASPSQDADDMAAKAQTYLQGGTSLVWVVWPQSGHIDVWHPGSLAVPATTLHAGDMLDGEDVVPGFTHPVTAVFADPLA